MLEKDGHFSDNRGGSNSYCLREAFVLYFIKKATGIDNIKWQMIDLPEDGPLRSDGSQQVLKKNWGSFQVLMMFMTRPLECLVSDVTMQEKKIWQNYSRSLECKKYGHRKLNHEKWNQSTAYWHLSHHQFEMDGCHYSWPEKWRRNSIAFIVKKEIAKIIFVSV